MTQHFLRVFTQLFRGKSHCLVVQKKRSILLLSVRLLLYLRGLPGFMGVESTRALSWSTGRKCP
ncbi:Uncharacterised protein [Shigella sonnei]|nr:Uncharacterised protein [Shigella sonnei]CSI07419.1 Uncharacterised protein [Shigella sonnei]CSI36532.1 Uncharacterised protein [Shigella sonnei]CSI83156.1 Uncharacterised protein [Shigella sonnei]CSL09373.1 Uncharacterised protein [Shigella sonnei]